MFLIPASRTERMARMQYIARGKFTSSGLALGCKLSPRAREVRGGQRYRGVAQSWVETISSIKSAQGDQLNADDVS